MTMMMVLYDQRKRVRKKAGRQAGRERRLRGEGRSEGRGLHTVRGERERETGAKWDGWTERGIIYLYQLIDR